MNDRPKYQRLKQTIRHNIRDGIWKPGDKLPSETTLCERFGVSKITVKKAKDELIAESVLETLPGRKGVFIRKLHGIPSAAFIGVVIDDINMPPFIEVFKGIEDTLWRDKVHVILGNLYSDSEKIEEYFQSLIQSNHLIGIIFAPVRGDGYQERNRKIIDLLHERRMPYILLDRYLPGQLYSSVVSNNWQASKDLITMLIRRGHTRILAIRGGTCSSMDERTQGYHDAFQETGVEFDPHLLIRVSEERLLHGEDQQYLELARIKQLLENAGDFTACYLMNTPVHKALRAIFSDRKAVNRHIEFVTYDGVTEELRGLANRVSVVRQPGYKMGREAANLLIKTLRDPDLGTVQMTLRSEIITQNIE